ncbi:MAG: hypothetical protein ACK45R_01750 [Candidatus Kapaibacterium sp.]|jgi:hypothetical protein
MVIAVTTKDAVDASNANTVQNTNDPAHPIVTRNGVPLPNPAPRIYMVDQDNVVDSNGTNSVKAGSLMVNVDGPTVTIIETTKPIVIL